AFNISRRLPVGARLVHVSGSLPLTVLDEVRAAGHPVGSFHPFQSFPFERPPNAFQGSLIGIDASEEDLLDRLFQLALDIGGTPRRVPDEQRALYHVAAVLSSNLLIGLTSRSAGVLESMGWSRQEAMAALLPLISGVVKNLAAEGLAGALIGPIRRGDPAAVSRHLDQLEQHDLLETARVYRILAMATLELALEAGLDPAKGDLIKEALTG
ncbi:MAG: DUF2520 domain-containing protein, partial [Candidatus Dormibacteraeota bacterium]|nr:DUF2520 domain-containing protein [Candidatus Dormibacteraeota bacterium]